MFYAHFVLSKKGPLARIWLAAHWDKKLTRAHVFETNISSSVEAILEPKVKLALRTSGHLLLGVVRIYSRQAKYLLADCNEAFVKIKMAFRPGAEMQEESHRDNSALASITLADNMHDFESTLAELTDMDPYSISVNQSRPEDITMREEFGEPNLGRPDDDFGDSTFEEGAEREYGGEHSVNDVMEMDEHEEAELTLTSELVRSQSSQVYAEMPPSVSMASHDGFDDMMDVDYDSGENLDRNMEEAVMFQDSSTDKLPESFSRIDSELVDTTTTSVTMDPIVEESIDMVPLTRISEQPEQPQQQQEEFEGVNLPAVANENIAPETIVAPLPIATSTMTAPVVAAAKRLPQFILPPVSAVQSSRIDHRRAPKRKRRLLIDEHKSIPSDVMKMQMQDTSEITTRLDLAPPTRKLMLWKETGSVDSLFTTPGRAIPSRVLQRLFYRNLKTVAVPNDSPDGLPVLAVSKTSAVVTELAMTLPPLQEQQHEELHEDENIFPLHTLQHEQSHNLQDDDDDHRPAGACSSYSANYDCFSGHATPHREDDDLNNNDNTTDNININIDTVIDPAAIETTGDHHLHDLSEEHSMFLEPIEEVRMSASIGGGANVTAYSTGDTAVFDHSFNDQSIVSVDATVLLDYTAASVTSSTAAMNMMMAEDHSHNKLQNTMLALDNELDIIDRQFPIEMTQEGLEKRSEIMLSVLQDAMRRDNNQVVFQHLTVSNNKKQAASKFYTLLLLGKQKAISLHQEAPFSNIIITPFQSS